MLMSLIIEFNLVIGNLLLKGGEEELVKAGLKPLGDRVVVKPEMSEERTQSGIVLPDIAKEKPQIGTVIAVGPGRILDNGQKVPLEIKVGDKVIYAKYGGTEVKVENDEYIILKFEDLLAIKE